MPIREGSDSGLDCGGREWRESELEIKREREGRERKIGGVGKREGTRKGVRAREIERRTSPEPGLGAAH